VHAKRSEKGGDESVLAWKEGVQSTRGLYDRKERNTKLPESRDPSESNKR